MRGLIQSMGTIRSVMLKKTHFDFLFGFIDGFLHRNMFPVVDFFWGFFSKFIVYVFGSIIGSFFRLPTNRHVEENDSGACLDSNFDELNERQSSDHVDQGNRERENSAMVTSSSKYEFLYRKGISGFIEEPKTESYTVHDFYMGSNDYAHCNGRVLDSWDSAGGRKVQVEVEDVVEDKEYDSMGSFVFEKALENFVEAKGIDEKKTEKPVEGKTEDSVETFIVEKVLEGESQLEETNAVSETKTEESAPKFFEKCFEKQIKVIKQEQPVEDYVGRSIFETTIDKPEQDIKNIVKEKAEDSVENFIVDKFLEKTDQDIETEDIFIEKAEKSSENYIIEKILEKQARNIEGDERFEDNFGDFFESPVTNNYLEKWHPETEESNEDGEMFTPRSKVNVESITNEVLSNRLVFGPQSHHLTDGQKGENTEHEVHECNTSISDYAAAIFRGPINYSDDELTELEPRSENLSVMRETESEEDLSIEDKDVKETEPIFSPEKTKEPTLQEESISNHEEQENDDSELGSEHADLIEQLKMGRKISRTGRLPTILEESECPKMVQELGPPQIEEKHDHKYHVTEIQKVYKSYSDKMRKLDILNSQTMHAISLLKLKDFPVGLSTSGKSSAPAIKSLFSHKILSFKQRKAEADPAMKLIRDLHRDFEAVYVGQVCISWEILNWQLGKVKKLLECDSLGVHQYNQVAGEFQHFQVLVQRFLEDEPFQTRPRVENYVKNRCALRHLLQVPVIKDDCSKYKEEAVSSEMLKDIIEESMHVFWEFLCADKDEANSTSKIPLQSQVAPQDPINFELLMDVRTVLQKKERRLKEIQRSTSCIIKKFQRQHQGNLLDHALFIAQVELKLVSRVLNMLKINTDQLVWCHEKLQRINFSRRKIEIEPSFTLFTC